MGKRTILLDIWVFAQCWPKIIISVLSATGHFVTSSAAGLHCSDSCLQGHSYKVLPASKRKLMLSIIGPRGRMQI